MPFAYTLPLGQKNISNKNLIKRLFPVEKCIRFLNEILARPEPNDSLKLDLPTSGAGKAELGKRLRRSKPEFEEGEVEEPKTCSALFNERRTTFRKPR